jgi:hypothetical protein
MQAGLTVVLLWNLVKYRFASTFCKAENERLRTTHQLKTTERYGQV